MEHGNIKAWVNMAGIVSVVRGGAVVDVGTGVDIGMQRLDVNTGSTLDMGCE